MPFARPNVRTATIATIRLSTGGCRAALAISHDDVAVRATPEPSAAVAARQARASCSRWGRIASRSGRHHETSTVEEATAGVAAGREIRRGGTAADGAGTATGSPRDTTRSQRVSTAGWWLTITAVRPASTL